jgi:ubiquinone/menaquinone biosynthesis C-methylase UbiE
MISGHTDIKAAYRDECLVRDYVASRFERDPFGREVHRRQVELLGRVVKRSRVDRLLEIACGPARMTVHTPKVPYACALEQSPAMLREAERRLKQHGVSHWKLVEGDAFALPFEDASFDMAMSFKFLRHFARSDRDRLMAGIRRVLRPGGKFVLDVANRPAYEWLLKKWGVEGSWVDDYWFTPDEFRAELQTQGFRVVAMHPVHSEVKAQYYIFSRLSSPLPATAGMLSRFLTRCNGNRPYEWLAECQCE